MPGLIAPMSDPGLAQPMREELTRIGFQELRTPAEVDDVLGTTKDTMLVVVNSVCGCAARNARPAATRSEEHTSELQSPCISYAVFCLKKKYSRSPNTRPLAGLLRATSCFAVPCIRSLNN